MQFASKITPCLWFDTQGEEAARYYVSLFPDSRIVDIGHYPEDEHEVHGRSRAGTVMTVAFEPVRGPLPGYGSRMAPGAWSTAPFAETKELIAGFLIVECDTLQKAIRWAKACPSMAGDGVAEMEVRQIVSAADIPAELAVYLPQLPWSSVAEATGLAEPATA